MMQFFDCLRWLPFSVWVNA